MPGLPVVQGVIDRRILANFRVDPVVLQKVLPPPFRPKLAHDWGMAGICLIRLRDIRPRLIPRFFGLRSENAAHRIAVEWDTPEGPRQGVYVPRRDTTSKLNAFAGGRLFPGSQHLASFEVRETKKTFFVSLRSRDGATRVLVDAKLAERLPETSIFGSIDEASAFFEAGSLGYSATSNAGEYDGMELHSFNWSVQPLEVTRVASSFFDDGNAFPKGSAVFDCALLMQAVDHQWRSRESLCCEQSAEAAPIRPRAPRIQ